MKSCGKCRSFIKFKTLVGNSGLCSSFDARTNADNGHSCREFKARKFSRVLEKRQIKEEIKAVFEE